MLSCSLLSIHSSLVQALIILGGLLELAFWSFSSRVHFLHCFQRELLKGKSDPEIQQPLFSLHPENKTQTPEHVTLGHRVMLPLYLSVSSIFHNPAMQATWSSVHILCLLQPLCLCTCSFPFPFLAKPFLAFKNQPGHHASVKSSLALRPGKLYPWS